jgi:hypothetical protein
MSIAVRYEKPNCVAAELFFSMTKVTYRQNSFEFQVICSAGAAVPQKSFELPDRDLSHWQITCEASSRSVSQTALPWSLLREYFWALALSAIRNEGANSERRLF